MDMPPNDCKTKVKKPNLDFLSAFIPNFSSQSIVFRITLSVIFLAAILLFADAAFDKQFELIKSAIQYDPYEHAQSLKKEGKIAAADDFLSFYEGLPGVEFTDEMKKLQQDVKTERGGFLHQGKEALRGVASGESDEYIGQALAFGTEFFFIGDLRDLGKEGFKAYQGEEIDHLTVSLSTIGLGMSAVSFFGPQAAAGAPAKGALGLFKRSSRSLTKAMRKHIDDLATFSSKLVKRQLERMGNTSAHVAEAFKKMNFSKLKMAEVKPVKAVEVLGEVDARKLNTAFGSLMTTGQLAVSDRKAASFLVTHANDFATLEKGAEIAKKLPKAGMMLENGGVNVLRAAEKFPPTTVNKALAYGKSGVTLLVQTGAESFISKVRWAKISANGKLWYHMKNMAYMIPWQISLVMGMFMLLILWKMWFPLRKKTIAV